VLGWLETFEQVWDNAGKVGALWAGLGWRHLDRAGTSLDSVGDLWGALETSGQCWRSLDTFGQVVKPLETFGQGSRSLDTIGQG
jgi:hypothetical protein